MSNEEYKKMIVSFKVQGAENEAEKNWAEKSALKVNHWIVKIYTQKFGPKNGKILNTIGAFLMLFAGGYDFKRKRAVLYNCMYEIKPKPLGKRTHVIEDMIFVKDFDKLRA